MAAGSIVIDLLMKTGSFETNSRKASKSLQGLAKDAVETGKKIAVVGAAAATVGAGIATTWAKSMVNTGKEIDRLSTLSNTSVESFQKMSYAAQTVGIEQEKLADIFKDVQDKVGDFLITGGGPLADFFEQIAPKVGVTAEQFRNLSGPEALGLYVESLEKAGVSQSEMVFFMEALASDSALLTPLLADNGREMARLGDEASRLGVVMDEDTVVAAKELDNNLNKLSKAATGLSIAVANEVLPSLNNFIESMLNNALSKGGFFDDVKQNILDVKFLIQEVTSLFPDMGDVAEDTSDRMTDSIGDYVADSIKELEDLGNFYWKVCNGIEFVFKALTDNLVTFFANAWANIKASAANALNSIIDSINKVSEFIGGGAIGHIAVPAGGGGEYKSLGQAYKEGAATGNNVYTFAQEFNNRRAAHAAATEITKTIKDALGGVSKPANNNQGTFRPTTTTSGGGSPRSGGGGRSGGGADRDLAGDYIKQLNERIALIGKETEAEKALVNIQLGKFGQLTELQKADILAKAEVLDLMEKQQKLIDKIGDDPMAYITGKVSPLSGGAFDDQVARYDAEAEQEEERYAEQLERLREAMEAKLLTMEEYHEKFEELQATHNSRMDQIDNARSMTMLEMGEKGFGAVADVMRQSQGEQSGIYKAMFAASKAFAVANATINAYDAISKAWASAPFPANLMAVAATVPQVMAVISAISGTSLKGMAHDGIDSVPETGTWLLQKGERVTTAATSAKLDSTLDRINDGNQKGGGVVVNLIEDNERAGQVKSRYENGQEIIDVVVANIRNGGMIARAQEATYGMRRVGA